ncbi:MAG: Mrp/NBP35 family ATP-binding protein [Ignisphaera sp.]|nr:Mrp/NBP35 family ATP-binding protein [Ignisphaera sp.]MCX8167920.1 Mrp/NBP35 family ATP-binding protein [Ignisphaera sp.]MDW8085735.1 P-loop NTPase [Ignisphaera sp.]
MGIVDLSNFLSEVGRVVIVMSGKGGVGKSIIASSLAIGLALKGRSVAILDADIHGPSVPWIMGVENGYMTVDSDGFINPIEIENIAVISIELLLTNKDVPLIWRGPLKTRAILEILSRTRVGKRDYLIIDMPPGTGDEPLTIVQHLKNKIMGAVLVTVPGELVKHVVTKAEIFLKELGVPLLGIVVNMSYFKCPTCNTIHRLFGATSIMNENIIAEIPIDPLLAQMVSSGKLIDYLKGSSSTAKSLLRIADSVANMEAQK